MRCSILATLDMVKVQLLHLLALAKALLDPFYPSTVMAAGIIRKMAFINAMFDGASLLVRELLPIGKWLVLLAVAPR